MRSLCRGQFIPAVDGELEIAIGAAVTLHEPSELGVAQVQKVLHGQSCDSRF